MVPHVMSNFASYGLLLLEDFNLPEIQWIDRSCFCNRDSPFCLPSLIILSVKQSHNQLVSGKVKYPTTLDLAILSNPDLLIKNVITTPVVNSDHVVIILELCLPTKKPSSKQQKYANYKLVSEKVVNVNWKKLTTDDIAESWSNVKTEILHIEKSCTRIFPAKQAKSLSF